VLNSKYGTLLPLFSSQQIGNALGWGLVDDTPNSFGWEIGHTSVFTSPAGRFCVPGQATCASNDIPHWLGFTPLKIVSVTFADGSAPKQWAVVSDLGGAAEVTSSCPSYGGAYCSYPWYAYNSGATALTYGGDYPQHEVRLRAGLAVRDHAAARRAVRRGFHLLRHRAHSVAAAEVGPDCSDGARG